MASFFVGGVGNFWSGVASSIFAALVCWIVSFYFGAWRTSRGMDIVGSWGEEITSDPQKKCGAGEIYYDKRRRMYVYNGSCYLSDGTRYSHWETMQSYFNRENKTLYYIFFGKLYDRPGSDHYGFGAVNLTEIKSKLTPTMGYFIAPQVDEKLVSHTMFRLNFLYSPDENGRKLINFIKSKRGKS